jgi:hypothetical protein
MQVFAYVLMAVRVKSFLLRVTSDQSLVTLSKNDWSGLGHMVVTPVHDMTKSSKFYKILTLQPFAEMMALM